MSGFDENPFAPPTIDDPFADPAIRRAVTSTPVNRGLEDYNPFAEQGTQGTAQVRGASNPPIYTETATTQQPATLQPSNHRGPPPSYTNSIPDISSFPAEVRSSEWNQQIPEDLKSPHYAKPYNWPPLPERCCIQPCWYQDIDVEIRPDFQKIVRQLYRLWIFHGCVLLLNVIGGFVLLLCYGIFSTFGLAVLYLILFTPFSFLCWFRPAYRAFIKDSSIDFMVFFFVFFFQLVVTAIQSIGIPGSGTCGIITAITTFDSTAKGIIVGLLLLIIALCFALAAAGDLLLLTKIHRIYRSSNASMSKAQEEFTRSFLRNEHVQSAASQVTASAIRTQMSNAANQPRY